MQCEIHNLVTIDIDDEFPWKDTWRETFSNVPGKTTSGAKSTQARVRLHYTRKLSADRMLKIGDGVYATEEFLLDRKYGVRFRKLEDRTLEIWTDNPCLEWQMWFVQLALLQVGATLVHCAAVAKNGEALIFPARGGVGKTMITRFLVEEMGWEFLGDDYIFLTEDGTCYSFPRPMLLCTHQGYLLKRTPGNIDLFDRIASLIKPLLRPFPRALHFTRARNPRLVILDPEKVFGVERLAPQALLTKVVLLDRLRGLDKILLERAPERILSRVFGSTYDEFDSRCSRLVMMSISRGILDAYEVYPVWLSILKGALAHSEHFDLLLPLNLTDGDMRASIRYALEQIER